MNNIFMFAEMPQIQALFTIPMASGKRFYSTSLPSFVVFATSFFMFLLTVLIMQRSISWTPVNKIPCKYHFEHEENYHNSINSRSSPKWLPTVSKQFLVVINTWLK